ncbi:hypothetical protein LCGC14_2134690 [marine sediment metagenome]|uniref:Uncharacterized protein n=1 Tax=marine sediment metagenome TaxID=412755 RepID=A0A0F9GWI3_9ZZZZ
MGKNELLILKIVAELLNILAGRAAKGEEVTDEDILKAKAKKDEAVAKWNET